ncbi:MAG: hypothetical protein OEW67_06890 [Cyclobacteriaceae bacterium]|nr:hypothetical protein [Cyclobacteriaceae bacterium]
MENETIKKEKDVVKVAKIWEVLLAGGIGAFIASIADMFTNQGESGVAELTKRIHLGSEGLALLLLVVLGVAICWVVRPATKLDGFARGLAILTIIGISSKNNLADEGLSTQQLSLNPTKKVEQPLLASLAWVDIHKPNFAPCPEGSGDFVPNATVIDNEWISSTKPETKWYSMDIFTTQCGNVLKEGQQIQLLDYFETSFMGYYYVQVKYQDSNNTLRIGWIYSGRSPNHFQKIKPDNPKLSPSSIGNN